jgi:hypothetical protein
LGNTSLEDYCDPLYLWVITSTTEASRAIRVPAGVREVENLNLKDNKVNQLALTKMSTDLASWRTRVKKRIDKKESWEEIKKHEPLLEHDDYVLFKEELETDTFKALSVLGKKMYEQNLGHHRLGSGGYRGIQEVWEKEDAELIRLGKPNMFDKFTDPQV